MDPKTSPDPEGDLIGALAAGIGNIRLNEQPKPLIDAEKRLAILPPEWRQVDLEKQLGLAPRVFSAELVARTLGDFVALHQRFASQPLNFIPQTTEDIAGRSQVITVKSILNFGEKDQPGHRTATLSYDIALSFEFLTLRTYIQGGKQLHGEFALLIEKLMGTIVAPAAADLWDMVRSFRAHQNVKFMRAETRTPGDVQFTYEQHTGASVDGGAASVPEHITFVMDLADGYPAKVEVRAKLLWQLKEGEVRFGLEVDKLVLLVEPALYEIRERVATAIDDVVVFGHAGQTY